MRRRTLLVSGTTGLLAGCVGYDIIDSDELEEMEELLAEQNETIQELESDIDEFQIQVSDQSALIDDLEGEISELEDDVETLESVRDGLQRELDETETELEEKRAELDERASTIDELESEVEALEGEIDALEADIESYQDQIDDLEERVADLDPESQFSDAEVEAITDVSHLERDAVGHVADWLSEGTAFHTGDGRCLTAEHIFRGSASFESIEFPNTDRVGFSIGASDESIDTEVLEAAITPDHAIEFGSIEDIDEGDVLFTIGHPYYVGYWIISVGRFIEEVDDPSGMDELFKADIPVQNANSGSPVFDIDGNVVGMITHRLTPDEFLELPDDPFFSFAGHHGFAGFVSTDTIRERLVV